MSIEIKYIGYVELNIVQSIFRPAPWRDDLCVSQRI
jgi:hypothetical protein